MPPAPARPASGPSAAPRRLALVALTLLLALAGTGCGFPKADSEGFSDLGTVPSPVPKRKVTTTLPLSDGGDSLGLGSPCQAYLELDPAAERRVARRLATAVHHPDAARPQLAGAIEMACGDDDQATLGNTLARVQLADDGTPQAADLPDLVEACRAEKRVVEIALTAFHVAERRWPRDLAELSDGQAYLARPPTYVRLTVDLDGEVTVTPRPDAPTGC